MELPALELLTDWTTDFDLYMRSEDEPLTEKFIWTITNFNRILPIAGIPFKSFIIHQGHARKVWRFFLYPSSDSDRDYMSARFAKAYSIFDPAIYNCSMSIVGSDHNPMQSMEFLSVDFDETSILRDKFLRRDFIEKLRKGAVTVQCEITEISPKSFNSVDDFKKLSFDLAALYQDPLHSDLTVHIQQFQFSVHTCVLYARCRRLSHEFGYESFKQMPKNVQTNSISPDLFHLLMVYLYSGRIEISNIFLGLFMLADRLKLQCLKQIIYEEVQEYRTHTEIATQTVTITWNLREIKFRDKGTVPFVQMFATRCCMTHLAVRMAISEHCDGEKYIAVSFKVFLNTLYKPVVSLLCVMTLFSNRRVLAYKKVSCNIALSEEWYFPPFVKLSDIPESDEDYGPDLCLTAEVSLSDGCSAYNILDTKTRMPAERETITYFERLSFDMGRLLSLEVESRFKKHDIYLKSADNYVIPAHKAILWARCPQIRHLLENYNEFDSYLLINFCRKEVEMFLDYIYMASNVTCPLTIPASIVQKTDADISPLRRNG